MANPYPQMAVGGRPSTASNLGATVGRARLFASKSGTVFQFRSLVAGAGAGVSLGGGEVTLSAPGANVTLSSAGAGASLVDEGAGPVLATKGLAAGTAVTLTAGASSVTVTANPPGESNTASNLGAGAGVFSAKVGADLQFRSLVGSGAVSAIADSPTAGNLLLTTAGFGGILGYPWTLRYEVASGTNGGATVAGWNTQPLNALGGNPATNVTLSGAPLRITMTTGTYWVVGGAPSGGASGNQTRFVDVGGSPTYLVGNNDWNQSTGGVSSRTTTTSEFSGIIVVPAVPGSRSMFLQHYVVVADATGVGLGRPSAIAGVNEVYAALLIFKIA